MTAPVIFDKSLIAPCGLNCGTCSGYLRKKNKCCGCRPVSGFKPTYCTTCKIKNCDILNNTASKFCYDCEKIPCPRLKQLDKRYRTKYGVNLIQNLMSIKEIGMTNYLAKETIRWTCPDCGSVICVHRDRCLTCNLDLKKKRLITRSV
jgi:hypothetical protein